MCVSRKPQRALISDFSSLDNSAFGVSPVDEVVGEVDSTGNVQIAFDNADWRTTGTLNYGDMAQLGITWSCEDISNLCPLDASAYGGIQFTIHSNGGQIQSADFFVERVDDDTVDDTIMCGTCVEPTPGYRTACLPPRVTFAITQAPTVMTFRWSDFSGGLPHAAVDPSQIASMYWFLHPAPPPDGGSGGTYDVDVTIDDIQFIPL